MYAQDRFFLALRWVRAAGLIALGLIAFSGAPEAALAEGGCDEYVYDCTDDVDDCVENLHGACPAVGECEYEIYCRASFHYPDCPNHEFIIMCEESEPN